jgi:hypothetical protein
LRDRWFLHGRQSIGRQSRLSGRSPDLSKPIGRKLGTLSSVAMLLEGLKDGGSATVHRVSFAAVPLRRPACLVHPRGSGAAELRGARRSEEIAVRLAELRRCLVALRWETRAAPLETVVALAAWRSRPMEDWVACSSM